MKLLPSRDRGARGAKLVLLLSVLLAATGESSSSSASASDATETAGAPPPPLLRHRLQQEESSSSSGHSGVFDLSAHLRSSHRAFWDGLLSRTQNAVGTVLNGVVEEGGYEGTEEEKEEGASAADGVEPSDVLPVKRAEEDEPRVEGGADVLPLSVADDGGSEKNSSAAEMVVLDVVVNNATAEESSAAALANDEGEDGKEEETLTAALDEEEDLFVDLSVTAGAMSMSYDPTGRPTEGPDGNDGVGIDEEEETDAVGNPPDAVDDTESTGQDDPVSGNVLDNDSDPDEGNVLTVTHLGDVPVDSDGTTVPLDSDAVVTVYPNGTYVYDPNGAFDSLPGEETAEDCFDYTVTDGNSNSSDVATVCIKVEGSNDSPVAVDDTLTTWYDESVTGNTLDNDSDPDGDALVVEEVEGIAVEEGGTAVDLKNGGDLTIYPNGTFEVVPGADFDDLERGESAETCFEYTVSDGSEDASAEVCVTVFGGDDDSPMTEEGIEATAAPTLEPSATPSSGPSAIPTSVPSAGPSVMPSTIPSDDPTDVPSDEPSNEPSSAPSNVPSDVPSDEPSSAPSDEPSGAPSDDPTDAPSNIPSDAPSGAPTSVPTAAPSSAPSLRPSPSFSEDDGKDDEDVEDKFVLPDEVEDDLPCGMTPVLRRELILSVLSDATDAALLRTPSDPRSTAAEWLIGQDDLYLCPSDPKLVQRWTLALVYFSTGGDDWFKCSAEPSRQEQEAEQECGEVYPFQSGEDRFLSALNECRWAGIKCNEDLCVTEVEFELNNLIGTMPPEISLLSNLELLGMERGQLRGPIPTTLGLLPELYFLDLDFNALTGKIPPEILNLTKLEQLDLNDNRLTGNIEGVEKLVDLSFLQLHNNLFTGTIPTGIGEFSSLGAFTVHENDIRGTMPSEICDLRKPESSNGIANPSANANGNGGKNLLTLIADCDGDDPQVECDCCSDCRL